MSPKENEFAKQFWRYQSYKHRQADRIVAPFLNAQITKFEIQQISKLKSAREALFLSQVEIARRLEISANAYTTIEANELKGTVTLNSLAKAADAFGC